jgi:DNA modification methylase
MKPYYDQDGITIYHGDCREILPSLPKARLVLTDPPYAIGAGRGEWAATAAVAIGLYEAAKRVTDDGAMLAFSTSSGRGIQYTLGAVGKTLAFNRLLVWHKALGTSKAAGPWKWDIVSILAFGRATFGVAERSSVLSTTEPRKGRQHPSQVPFDVAQWLYGPFSSDATTPVIDPFVGSGRLLMPAVGLGHRVIGIDTEEKYCELAVRNLAGVSGCVEGASMEPALTLQSEAQ